MFGGVPRAPPSGLRSPSARALTAATRYAVGIDGADAQRVFAEAEGGVEVLRGGADVPDRRVLRLVVPLANWHFRELREYVETVEIAEVLLAVHV